MSNISLIVTTYNSNRVVGRFLNWLEKSRHFFYEVIIVDDFSSDRSDLVIKDKITCWNNVTLYKLDKNSGRPSIPRNYGVSLATGAWIMFLDIDDLLTGQYLQTVLAITSKNTNKVISATKLKMMDFSKFNYDYYANLEYRRVHLKEQRHKNQITFSGSCLPVKVAKAITFPNQPLEDWIYWNNIMTAFSDVIFLKYKYIPVAYDASLSLSPIKTKQLKRVIRYSKLVNVPYYFLYTLRLRVEEARLRVLYRRHQAIREKK